MKFWINLNHKKIAAISISVVVFSIFNGFVIMPKIIKFMVKRNLQLRPGSQMRPMFEKIPFPLVFKIHVFNITNPDDVMKGEKPKLVDIGPYVFDEWKIRDDIVDDKKNDTISYTFKNRFHFRRDLSGNLTGEEIITIPNIILLGTMSVIKRDREAMLPFVIKGMRGVFQEPKSPFMSVRAMDYLFDGVGFTCDGDFNVKTLCAGLEAEAASQIFVYNETYFRFSILGDKNRTNIGRFTVKRGIQNIHDLGRIVTFDNQHTQTIWEGDTCNMINGTDSTIFPPFLERDEGLWTFTPDICMSLRSHYVGESSFDGMPTREYSADFGDMKNEPDKHCFCEEWPDECPPRGLIDLFPCLKAPLFGSKPHFLDSDPYLLSTVEGLSPDRSLHDIKVTFEPISGTPFEGAKRLQFNFQIEPVEDYEILANLPNLILPIIWVEEGVKLNKTYTNLLKYQLFLGMKVNSTFKWMGIVVGSILFVASLISFVMQQKAQNMRDASSKSTAVTSIKPVSAASN